MERGKERVIVGDVGSEDLEDNDDLELDFHLGMPGSGVGGGMRRDLGDGEVRRDGCGQVELLFSGSQHRYLQFVEFGDEVGDGSGPSKLLLDLMDTEDYDGDLQNKRPKFDSSSFAECHTSSADSRNITTGCSFNDFRNSCFPSFPSDNNNVDAAGPSNGEDSTEENGISMDLSDDLLHMVFSFLDPVDLCRAAMVCKQWQTSSTHEDFWRLLDFSDRDISVDQREFFGVPTPVALSGWIWTYQIKFVGECSNIEDFIVEDICRRYSRATEVSFSGSPGLHLLAMRAVPLLRNLQALTLGKGSLGEAFFLALKDCQMLKCLTINDATLANSVQDIAIHHDRLQLLQITKCRVLRVSVRCPQLETLSLKRSNMAHAALTCLLLRDLDIGSCHKLSDAAVRAAVTSCPLLEILDISNCSCVTDETLREIALVCANLCILDASYCPNISLESVRLSMLTDLKLASCEGITSASMAAISHSYMLEELDLDNCSVLTSVSLDLSHLRNISLVHCRKLVDLSLRCLKLSSLTVLNSAALNHINITSDALKKLILKKQESLTSLSLQCPYLQEVDLSDCESLTDSICEVFSDGGGCPVLRSLYLDNCESLTAVGLQSTSLVSLSLAGCRGITTLDLKCPYLQQVCLDCCDHLERASFGPVTLQSLNLGICPKLEVLSVDGPQMVLLELKGCGVLSQASINCPTLTSLDASFCCELQDDCLSATTSSCPQIESLILMSCPAIGSAGLFSLQWLRNLTYLDLSYTFLTDLRPIYQACTQLKVLKLQACKYLNESSLDALYTEHALPALQELDLSYGVLGQSAIEELLAYCTQLTHLSLNGCENMHDLDWSFFCGQFSELPITFEAPHFPSMKIISKTAEQPHRLLEHLNCVGCQNIKKVFIPPMACWEQLSYLNLSLSTNLKQVDITCSNLCFLNLSNCCSLEFLKLECPRLVSLFLQSCSIDEEAVGSAISRCNMLETLDVRFCPKIYSVSIVRLRMACPSLKRIFSSISP